MNTITQPNKKSMQNDAGLTIIELLIVLVVLSLIATVTTVQIMNQFQRAQGDVVNIQIQKLKYAIELYQIDVGEYPSSKLGLTSLFESPQNTPGWRGPYVASDAEILDPWKTPLKFVSSPGSSGYSIVSAGPDRAFDKGSDDIVVEVKN